MCRGIKPGPLFWAYAGSQSRGVGPWRVIIALPSNYVLEPIKGGGGSAGGERQRVRLPDRSTSIFERSRGLQSDCPRMG